MRCQTPQGFMKTSDWGEDRDCEEWMEEYIGEFSPYTLYLAEKGCPVISILWLGAISCLR